MRISALTAVSLLALTGLANAQPSRELRLEYTGDITQAFRVENLAGAMTVRPGKSSHAVVTAKIYAEDPAIGALMRLEQGRDRKTGQPTVRVVYPTNRYTTFRYSKRRSTESEGFFSRMFSGTSNTEYDGEKVTVSGSRGVALHADVTIEVPRGAFATFRNVVGTLTGSDVEGHLKFDTASGDIALSNVAGDITADTGSGDVNAQSSRGSLKCDTGSGDCVVDDFSGDVLDLDTGSGDINARKSRARSLKADTGSGDINLDVDEVEAVEADTGSGDVVIIAGGSRLSRIKADTGSGDVSLSIEPGLGFELRADQGSGDLDSDFSDAQPILQRRKVVGYRRGDERVKIDIDTGSGDVHLGRVR